MRKWSLIELYPWYCTFFGRIALRVYRQIGVNEINHQIHLIDAHVDIHEMSVLKLRYYNYLIIHGHGHRCADLVYLFVYVTWTMTWNRYSFRPLLLHKFMRCIHRHCCGHFHRRYCPFSIHFVSWSYAISLVIFVGFFRWEISLYFIIFKHTTKLPKYMYLSLVLSSSVWSVQFYSVLPNHLIQFIFAHCLWCF